MDVEANNPKNQRDLGSAHVLRAMPVRLGLSASRRNRLSLAQLLFWRARA